MITIQTSAPELIDKFSALISKQMPFVMALTLTGLAFDVRDQETKGLLRYFKIRTNWTKKTLKVIKAKKNDYPEAFSIVGVRDKIMALNITGGTRENESGLLAVPNQESRRLLNPGIETLGPPKFPKKIINSKKTYYGNRPFYLKSKNNQEFIAVRTSKKRTPIDFIYKFKERVNIKEKWPFIDNAGKIVKENYSEKFKLNLERALS